TDADCSVGACAFGSCNDDGLGPETYIVPGDDTQEGDFVYVVTWSDDATTQGLLGRFAAVEEDGSVLYTGDPQWTVCATGVDYDIDGDAQKGPPLATINEWIGKCNDGEG